MKSTELQSVLSETTTSPTLPNSRQSSVGTSSSGVSGSHQYCFGARKSSIDSNGFGLQETTGYPELQAQSSSEIPAPIRTAESPPSTSTEGWSKVAKILRHYDETKIKDCKEDIDTLLVFAGLFSAVVTAFNIDLYKTLLQDPTSESTQLLLQIAQQLSSMSSSTGSINPTASAAVMPPTFQPSASAIRINTLWFLSLVCSLITASLGILVKQWLREYMANDSLSPQAQARVRHFRYQGLIKYRVLEVASCLPFLLQFSLMLFFAGLCDFLQRLHPLIGWVVTLIIISWLVVFIITTVAPAFSAQCPYKTPLLRGVWRTMRTTLWNRLRYIVLRSKHDFKQSIDRLWTSPRKASETGANHGISIEGLEQPLFSFQPITEETDILKDPFMDINVLVAADTIFMDNGFLDLIHHCTIDESPMAALDCIRRVLGHRLGFPITQLQEASSESRDPLDGGSGTIKLGGILIDIARREMAEISRSAHTLGWNESLVLREVTPLIIKPKFSATEGLDDFLGAILGLNEDCALHCTFILSRQAPFWSALPQLSTPKEWSNFMSISQKAIDIPSDDVDILQLCTLTLAIASKLPNHLLQKQSSEFQDLQVNILTKLDHRPQLAMMMPARCVYESKGLIDALYVRVPEVVDCGLKDGLSRMATRTKRVGLQRAFRGPTSSLPSEAES